MSSMDMNIALGGVQEFIGGITIVHILTPILTEGGGGLGVPIAIMIQGILILITTPVIINMSIPMTLDTTMASTALFPSLNII